jgi:hypothetical protein
MTQISDFSAGDLVSAKNLRATCKAAGAALDVARDRLRAAERALDIQGALTPAIRAELHAARAGWLDAADALSVSLAALDAAECATA